MSPSPGPPLEALEAAWRRLFLLGSRPMARLLSGAPWTRSSPEIVALDIAVREDEVLTPPRGPLAAGFIWIKICCLSFSMQNRMGGAFGVHDLPPTGMAQTEPGWHILLSTAVEALYSCTFWYCARPAFAPTAHTERTRHAAGMAQTDTGLGHPTLRYCRGST